jgi:hypothetical protein
MRSGRADLSWFLRAARVVPVIAGAALLGGMIGGFAIFAIDSALTWEPNPQSRPDGRAENQASAGNPQAAQTTASQTTKPVRIVGGAIPDPSAGMSAPPPALQQRSATAPPQSQTQVSPQLLTGKPLGPATQLQPQTATTQPQTATTQPQTATTTPPAPASGTTPANQSANQPQTPVPVQTQKVRVQTQNAAPSTVSTQQQTRWPDALSRAHQNAANTQQQTAPSATAPPTTASAPPATAQTKETDRKATSQAAAGTEDQDRPSDSRRARQSRRHASRYGETDQGSGADYSSRRQQARSYDRLYDSYGNRRDRSYGNAREQFYGDRDNQNDTASQYGRDTRNRGRSRAIGREQPDQSDRTQAYETPRGRPEPFWGGGFFGRGYQGDGD